MFRKILSQNLRLICKINCRRLNIGEISGFPKRTRTYYEILGVPKTATKKEIKKAYVELSKKFHPDSANDQNDKKLQEKFVEITEACRVLTKRELKEAYDKLLEDPFFEGQPDSVAEADHFDRHGEFYMKLWRQMNSNMMEEIKREQKRLDFAITMLAATVLGGLSVYYYFLSRGGNTDDVNFEKVREYDEGYAYRDKNWVNIVQQKGVDANLRSKDRINDIDESLY